VGILDVVVVGRVEDQRRVKEEESEHDEQAQRVEFPAPSRRRHSRIGVAHRSPPVEHPQGRNLSGKAFAHDVFSSFDRLAEHNGLEKIKTIGDAYLAVGGSSSPSPTTWSASRGWRSTCRRR
jgi:class 3 adenylate cyclase